MQIRDSVSILCPVDNVSDIERRHPERERGGCQSKDSFKSNWSNDLVLSRGGLAVDITSNRSLMSRIKGELFS